MPQCSEGCSNARHESSNVLHERFEHTAHQKRGKARQDPCYVAQAGEVKYFCHPPAVEVWSIESFHQRAPAQSKKSPGWLPARLKLQHEWFQAIGQFRARAR